MTTQTMPGIVTHKDLTIQAQAAEIRQLKRLLELKTLELGQVKSLYRSALEKLHNAELSPDVQPMREPHSQSGAY